QNSGTLYVGTGGGDPRLDSVFKTTDGGTTWRALKSGSVFGLSTPLAIDPQNPNVLYASNYNDIIKTTDGGATWRASSTGLPIACCQIARTLAIDPGNPANVYAALGNGLFRSTDRVQTGAPCTCIPASTSPSFGP